MVACIPIYRNFLAIRSSWSISPPRLLRYAGQARSSRFRLDVPVLISFSFSFSLSEGEREAKRKTRERKRERDSAEPTGNRRRRNRTGSEHDGESGLGGREREPKIEAEAYIGTPVTTIAPQVFIARPNLLGGFGQRDSRTRARTHARVYARGAVLSTRGTPPDERNRHFGASPWLSPSGVRAVTQEIAQKMSLGASSNS